MIRREPLIVTFTANPSIDRTLALGGELLRGEVQRAAYITEQAAGKGINVARVIAASSQNQVLAVCAGLDDQFTILAAHCQPQVMIRGVELSRSQRVRGNTTVTEPEGVTTKINGLGPRLTAAQVAEASSLLIEAAQDASWVALCGSLPPGAPSDWYAQLICELHGTDAKIAVDTSNASLDAAIARLPEGSFDLIKPNSDELAQLTGGSAIEFERAAREGRLDEIADAATRLHRHGITNVLVTLGASGAVLVDADGVWYATAPYIEVASTVGAGDSSVAGFILADLAGRSSADCLASAVAYGSAAASLPGTSLPSSSDLPAEIPFCTQLR